MFSYTVSKFVHFLRHSVERDVAEVMYTVSTKKTVTLDNVR